MSRSITIDGPAAAGKTTMAKALAERLPGFRYVDTGAFYRATALALTYKYDSEEIPLDDPHLLDEIDVRASRYDNGVQTMGITASRREHNGYRSKSEWVKPEKLRTETISQLASKASAIPAVRTFVNQAIRAYAADADVIMEGRDTGSVILPDAMVKFYLTGDQDERTIRRWKDLGAEARGKLDEIRKDMAERDERDMNRTTDPLVVPKGAIYIDNTSIPKDACIQLMYGIAVHLI